MKWVAIASAAVVLFAGCYANITAYYDHSPYWGVPVSAPLASAEGAEATDVDTTDAGMHEVLASKLKDEATDIVRQQRFLYNELFKSIVKLERESRMLPEAIAKIGPMANMDLKDLTGTDAALDAVVQYQANLPAESPARLVTAELLMNLTRGRVLRGEFVRRMYAWQTENPIVVEYTPPSYTYVTTDDGYASPGTEIVEVAPGRWNRTWSISEADGRLLGMTHKLHTDIDLAQIRLVGVTLSVVEAMKAIDRRSRAASDVEVPAGIATFMFVQAKSPPHALEGRRIRKCLVGPMFCHGVGRIATALRAHTLVVNGRTVDGFLVEISLDDKSAMKVKALHVSH